MLCCGKAASSVAAVASPDGPAFGPEERIRPGQVEYFRHWQDLVDKRLIGNVPEKTLEQRAAIDAWERVLGVGEYRGR